MVELSNPRPEELSRQRALWRRAFGNAFESGDFYYSSRYRAEETFVLRDEQGLQSMMTGLPSVLRLPDGSERSCAYVYAVATNPDARRKGYAGTLLRYADLRFQEQDVACAALMPSEERLYQYYAGFGFEKAFAARELRVERRSLPAGRGSFSPAEPGEYNRQREELLKGRFHLSWGDEGIALQKGFSQRSGAEIYLLETPFGPGCAAAERGEDGGVVVKELLAAGEAVLAGAALVGAALPAAFYTFRFPAFYRSVPGGRRRDFGMLKWYAEPPDGALPPGWLGLAFD